MLDKLNMDVITIFKESTFLSKAKLKTQTYKLPFGKFIISVLPLIFSLGNTFGIQNKIVVLARKRTYPT